MNRFKIMALVAMISLLAAPTFAQDDPKEMPDDSWVSLNGTVVSAADDVFTLDYGEGMVLVEMDDFGWDWYEENYSFLDGHKVTVYGEVDDDLFESTSIEASSVYDETLNSYFYANSADEEDGLYLWTYTYDPYFDGMTVRGTVTSVDGREFTIDRGLQELTVDTSLLGYNPMDDEGFQKIEVGDRVSVGGDLNLGVFEERELIADWIVSLGG